MWSKVKFQTSDLGYPKNSKARAFCALWAKLFDDSQREIRYLAKLACREYLLYCNDEAFGLQFYGFNSGSTDFHTRIISQLKQFEVSEQ